MKIVVLILSLYILGEVIGEKDLTPADKKPDYCAKLDTLLQERYYSKEIFFRHSQRILHEIEEVTKIYGTYEFGFAGMTYCDTFFNNDFRRWQKAQNCNEHYLPPAPGIISPPCDTTKFIVEER